MTVPPSMHAPAIITHDGRETTIHVQVMTSERVFTRETTDAKEGDRFQCAELGSECFVISKVTQQFGPTATGRGVVDTQFTLVSEAEWARQTTPARTTVNQTFASAGVVAGRDVHGPITFNVKFVEVFGALERKIAEDPAIPPEEKQSLLAKLKEFANNAYVSGLATAAIWDGFKMIFAS